MLSPECLGEFRGSWLPHITDAGLDRLIDLLEHGSPLLIHGCFTKAVPMGCLASHVALEPPEHLPFDPGRRYYLATQSRIAQSSDVALLREWDQRGICDLEMRSDLIDILSKERSTRQTQQANANAAAFRSRPDSETRCCHAFSNRKSWTRPRRPSTTTRWTMLTVNRVFVDDFLALWDAKSPVLDIGTGTAQIPIALCLASRERARDRD